MLSVALSLTLGLVAAAIVLIVWRLLRGPDAADRVLALDTLGITVIGLVMLLGLTLGLGDYFEISMLLAMMGFVGTVALSKFLLLGDVIE